MRSVMAKVFLITVSSFLVPWLALSAFAAAPAIEQVLPPGFHQNWVQGGKVSLYNQETLFEHINGEAELYIPYRFDLLVTAGYVSKQAADVMVVADVYRMGSLLDAFGIYANYRRVDYESVKVGAEGFISPTQLMFYQDRYFVRLQVTGATGLPREVFLDCARRISENLPANLSRPQELEIFSLPAIIPRSERYYPQSLLGYAFFKRGLIADAGRDGETMRVFIMTEASAESARKVMEAYRRYLKEEGQGLQMSRLPDREVLTVTDSLYGFVRLEQSDRYLIGAAKVKDRDAAQRLVEMLRQKMTGGKRP